jgi:hypothetical protein
MHIERKVSKLKPKKCSVCKELFMPYNSLQKTCGPDCAIKFVRLVALGIERKKLRQDKLKIKTRREWLREAQDAFNNFVRARDHGAGCIDCGWQPTYDDPGVGGTFDAGHFLSVGSHPELRFIEDNCHMQKKACNGGSGRFARKARTVSQQYRERLIAKIGLDRVLWLEGPHEPKKYTIEDLIAIKKEYQTKLRELKKSRE